MKKIIFIILMTFSCNVFAQNISFDELISLRKKDIADVEEFLTENNWSLLSAQDPTSENMGSANFSFKKNAYEDTAESFVTYFYSINSDTKRLNIQIHKKEIYLKYLNRIKSLGCKLIESKIEDNKILKVYQGKTTTFQISTNTIKNDFGSTHTIYHIFISDISDDIYIDPEYMWKN